MALSVSECCLFPHSGSKWTDMPCLKFFWEDMADPHIEKISHIMADLICPVLLDTVIKGDPRLSTVNIVWINPGTTSWVQSPNDSKGELAVEVTLEKTAVRQSGDAWRIVLDCCLPVFHLIDTRRSIPYAIKQIQDLIGISCGFDQAVQRLSTSVTLVTKGVLKEHLILLASSMTCSGNLVGFNISGIKALYRALSVQAPFTEATLYTPRKCFERASEKCHVDSLAGVVASCSWGKRVAVGTGANFDVLWDTKEVEKDGKPIDVYNFLHLVRSSNEEEMDTGCLGEDIDKFDWVDAYMEPALSPDQENKAVFDDIIELGMDSQEHGGGNSGWDAPSSGPASSEGNGWSNWGQKKEQAEAVDSSKSGGWDAPSQKQEVKSQSWGNASSDALPSSGNGSAEEGTGWASWGPKKDPAQPENKSGSGGWDALKSQDSLKEQGWSTGFSSGSGSAEGNGSANWGSKKNQAQPENSSKPVGWGASKIQDSEKEESKAWDNVRSSRQEKATWGPPPPSAASWKQNSHNGDANQGSGSQSEASWSKKSNECGGGWTSTQANQPSGTGGWGSEKKESNTQSSWVQKNRSSGKTNHQADSGTWGSQKEENPTQSSWTQQKSGRGDAGGWSSDKVNNESGFKSWDSKNGERKSQSSWKNSVQSADEWGSDKSSQPGISSGWGSGKATVASSGEDYEEGGSSGWEPRKGETKTQSSWGQHSDSTAKNPLRSDKWSNQTGKDNEVGGSKSWESRKEEISTQPTWGQAKDATWKNEKQTGTWETKKCDQPDSSSDKWSNESGKDNEVCGSKSWETKKGENSTQSTWGQPRNSTSKNDKQIDAWDSKKSDQPRSSSSWGSEKGGSGSLDKVVEENSSGAWDKTEEIKTQSSWGQPSESTWKSTPRVDGWGSNKSVQSDRSSAWGSGKAESGSSDKAHEEDSSGAWGSKSEDRKTQSSWGQRSETTWKSSPSADGWGSGKADNGGRGHSFGRGSGRSDNGGRGWGSSNSGEWKSRKNRPPRQSGSNDESTNVAFTATRKRMDIFPVEEQDALSEVETIMQSIRRIMHQSGSNDGDPLPSDDQSYIINNVLEYHPDKEAKKGAGIDFITVKKHSSFQESRCFYVVSTDGQAEDFSYIKCLENFIKDKYPSIAESFTSKYFRKPRAGGNRQQGQQNFLQNAPESPNFTQNAPDSPNFKQNTPES